MALLQKKLCHPIGASSTLTKFPATIMEQQLQTQTPNGEIFMKSLFPSIVYNSLCENNITYQLYLYDYPTLKFLYINHLVINDSLISGMMGLFIA